MEYSFICIGTIFLFTWTMYSYLLSVLFFFYCSGFCHTLKWNSHGFTCVPHPDPPSHLPLHPLPLGFPVHQVRALVSCIQPGLVICFTLDNIHVSMLFSWNIPPSPSPTLSILIMSCWGFPGGTSGKEPAASAGNIIDTGLIPGLGRFPGGSHGHPL